MEAIDMIPDYISSVTTPPRISFSNNLDDHQHEPDDAANNHANSYSHLSDPDFNFATSSIDADQATSADELFSDGQIRALQLQEKFVTSKTISIPKFRASLPPLSPPASITLKEIVTSSDIETEQKQDDHQSNSNSKSPFWRIKRSFSLHSDSSHKKSSIWSLPLLSRSNSTGSITKALKEGNNKKRSMMASSASSGNVVNSFYTYPLMSQKPPLRKSYGSSSTTQSNGVRISPVLNVQPSCNIKGTANLLGFGYLFRNGKDTKNKNRPRVIV